MPPIMFLKGVRRFKYPHNKYVPWKMRSDEEDTRDSGRMGKREREGKM